MLGENENFPNSEKKLFKIKLKNLNENKYKHGNGIIALNENDKQKHKSNTVHSTIAKTSDNNTRRVNITTERNQGAMTDRASQKVNSTLNTNTNSILSKFRLELEQSNKPLIEEEILNSKIVKQNFEKYLQSKKKRAPVRINKNFNKIEFTESDKLSRNKNTFFTTVNIETNDETKRTKNQLNLETLSLSRKESNISNLFKTDIPKRRSKIRKTTVNRIQTSFSPLIKSPRKSLKKTQTFKLDFKKIDLLLKSKNGKENLKNEEKNISKENSLKEKIVENEEKVVTKPIQGKKSQKEVKITSSNPQNINNIEEKIIRKKNFKVIDRPNWYEKMGLPNQTFSNLLIGSVEYQSTIIIDEMRVLVDNIQFFKTNFLANKDMIYVYRNMQIQAQTKYNKIIEETCGILMQISQIILLDFSQYLEKFVSIRPPAESRFKITEVRDEENCFISDCNLLNDVSIFLKSCFEVYNILISQVDDMVIPTKNFQKLIQFLCRARYNISSLIMSAKNYLANMKFDLKTFQKFKNSIIRENEKREAEFESISSGKNFKRKFTDLRKKPQLPKISSKNINHNLINERRYDLTEKIRKQFEFKLNEEKQKIARLNNVLDRNEEITFEELCDQRKINKQRIHKSTLVSALI